MVKDVRYNKIRLRLLQSFVNSVLIGFKPSENLKESSKNIETDSEYIMRNNCMRNIAMINIDKIK